MESSLRKSEACPWSHSNSILLRPNLKAVQRTRSLLQRHLVLLRLDLLLEHVEELGKILVSLELGVCLLRLLHQLLVDARAPLLVLIAPVLEGLNGVDGTLEDAEDVLHTERVDGLRLVELVGGGPVHRWLFVGVRGWLLREVVYEVLRDVPELRPFWVLLQRLPQSLEHVPFGQLVMVGQATVEEGLLLRHHVVH